MSIALEFDQLQPGYTGKISRWVPHYQQLISGLISYLPVGFQPMDVMDLGCGNGNATAIALQRFPNACYTLVDASAEMIGEGRHRFSEYPGIEYIQTYFQTLVIEPESLDLVFAGLSLHHLKSTEKQDIFNNIFRWLRAGGVLTISDLFVNKRDQPFHDQVLKDWEAFARAHATTDEEWNWIMDHYRTYDYPDAYSDQLSWLRAVGFTHATIVWQEGPWGVVQAVK